VSRLNHEILKTPNLNFPIPPKPINELIASPRRCDHCLKPALRLVRYVEQIDGGNSDACRDCFFQLLGLPIPQARSRRFPVRNRSRIVRARLQLAELFSGRCPSADWLRGAITPLAATPALGAVRSTERRAAI
jgi:hypothetical protein